MNKNRKEKHRGGENRGERMERWKRGTVYGYKEVVYRENFLFFVLFFVLLF